jgi:hypothetical protein
MSYKINWQRAPAVPVKVHQAKAAGKDIGGEIITGPMGQTTFVPHDPIVPSSHKMTEEAHDDVVHSSNA